MTNRITHGIGRFLIDGKEPGAPMPNLSHDFNSVHVFEAFVRNGRWANYSRMGTRVTFRRHSLQRPYVANLRHRGRKINTALSDYHAEWEMAVDYDGALGNPAGTNGTLVQNSIDYSTQRRAKGRTFNLNAYSAPVGSYCFDWDGDFSGNNGLPLSPGAAAGAFFHEALSEIDLPQTTIGNIHKHPYNRGEFHNAVGVVALSQGQITLSGIYNPPEHKLLHTGQQVYYAKTGGTGVIQGAVKTTGETFPAATSAARFRDTTFAGFVVGDVGKYIAVHGLGIYLITAFVDASNVDMDAVTINEPFTNATGLTWTLRTGPIGEYFWRRRGYGISQFWVNYVHVNYNNYWFTNIDEVLHAAGATEWNQIPQRVVYDGYGHWWWTTPNRGTAPTQRPFGIMRQLHMSSQPMQGVLQDGSLLGLTNWGSVADSGQFRDIIVDRNKKLWVSCKPQNSTTFNSIARIHPAPGGNATNPTAEALWRKQQTDADAAGLTSHDIEAMCDDRSGVHSGGVGTHRIWAIGGSQDTTYGGGAAGGLSYTDDEGVTWKRVHQLPVSLTGTAGTTSGSAAVTGSSTTYLTQYAVGDYIRFAGDTAAYRVLLVNSNTSITLATNYVGTTATGKAHAKIQKGQVTTTASTAITATEGAFLTQFSIGDWVRFAADTRSYRITAIADDNNMTITPSYAGTPATPVCLRKGALEANEAILKTDHSYPADNANDAMPGQHNIDWDTLGRVFWLSSTSPARICRWDESAGVCVSFAETSIAAVTGLPAVSAGNTRQLKVTRIPNVAGVGVHPFHNDIWLGLSPAWSAPGTEGGWVRVIGSTFTTSPTSANFTRYHIRAAVLDNFPTSVNVPADGTSTEYAVNARILQEPVTGNIILFSSYVKSQGNRLWGSLKMTGTDYWKPVQNMYYPTGDTGAAIKESIGRGAFDEEGMGVCCIVSGAGSVISSLGADTKPPMSMNFSVWIDRRWDGTAWREAMLGGSTYYDFNLRGGTNALTQNAVLGAGFRRMHEWPKPLDDGMYIAFTQAGGAVAQTDEFLADEASTFTCYIGAGKDNTQTCTVLHDMYVNPTAYRVNEETTKLVRNLWTQDGGVEGGYTSSNTGSLSGLPGPFTRGAVDYFKYPVGYGVAAGYLGTNNQTINSTTANQPFAALRIADEGEFAADGAVTAASTTFTSAGGHVFVPGDVGKSIFIEGVNGVTANADNGQAVIMAYISATQVTTDKVFVATGVNAGACRWKLRNVPLVSFVELGVYNTNIEYIVSRWRHDLWSSKDKGQNWALVKFSDDIDASNVAVNGPDAASPGTWYTSHHGYQGQLTLTDDNMVTSGSVIFDLRDLPTNTRRREYWRWRMFDESNDQGSTSYYAGMYLYDDNFVLINRPANVRVEDADDPLFYAVDFYKTVYVRQTGASLSSTDNADFYTGTTDLVTTTTSLHLDSGVNDAQVTSAGRFIDPGASFNRKDFIGRYIRVSGAANAANNGWAIITGFVSNTEVQTSKNFVNETNTFTWAMLEFGPGDDLRINATAAVLRRGQPLNDTYYPIIDVPTSTTIQVSVPDIPHPTTAQPWEISRNATVSVAHPSSISAFDTAGFMAGGFQNGIMHWSYDLEFVTVQSSTVSATTPADDDADGRTDHVIVGEALLAAGGATDGPIVGDFLQVIHATFGTRIFEIVGITGTDIKIKYDEMLPSIASGLTWVIRRRRDLSYRNARISVTGRGAPPP